MTELLVASAGVACIALSRAASLAGAKDEQGEVVGWSEALSSEICMLQPWLAVGPLCWAGALGLSEAAEASTRAWALSLGLVPVVGALLTFGVALLRVALRLARQTEDDDVAVAPLVLAGSAASVMGLGGGVLWQMVALF